MKFSASQLSAAFLASSSFSVLIFGFTSTIVACIFAASLYIFVRKLRSLTLVISPFLIPWAQNSWLEISAALAVVLMVLLIPLKIGSSSKQVAFIACSSFAAFCPPLLAFLIVLPERPAEISIAQEIRYVLSMLVIPAIISQVLTLENFLDLAISGSLGLILYFVKWRSFFVAGLAACTAAVVMSVALDSPVAAAVSILVLAGFSVPRNLGLKAVIGVALALHSVFYIFISRGIVWPNLLGDSIGPRDLLAIATILAIGAMGLLSRAKVVSFTVAIAGDSATGKDTLAANLINLRPDLHFIHLTGDDYHKWPRTSPNWHEVTHLNPEANRLTEFARDVANVSAGKLTRRPRYDHQTGEFSNPSTFAARPNIVVSGLHAIFALEMSQTAGAKVFLELDNELREQVKLERDSRSRNKSREETLRLMAERAPDFEKYVLPQRSSADLVFSITGGFGLDGYHGSFSDRLTVIARNEARESVSKVARALSSSFGLQVSKRKSAASEETVTMSGHVSKRRLGLIAKKRALISEGIVERLPGGFLGVQILILTQLIGDRLENSH